MNIDILSFTRCDVGEGPIYNAQSNLITWVDITGMYWHQSELLSQNTKSRRVSNYIGAVVETTSSQYFAAVKEGYAYLNDDHQYTVVKQMLGPKERMNDAKADKNGYWWSGSNAIDFSKNCGKLFRIDNNFEIKLMIEGLTLPNGMTWNNNQDKFFLVDTLESVIWSFEFNLDTSEIENKKLLTKFHDNTGLPDGMTITNDDLLIVAMWDGGRLDLIDLNGKKQGEIKLPIARPTSCTFAGENLDLLVVTSAARDQSLHEASFDGYLLAISGLGISGEASNKFNDKP